jgi:hypothetical protein
VFGRKQTHPAPPSDPAPSWPAWRTIVSSHIDRVRADARQAVAARGFKIEKDDQGKNVVKALGGAEDPTADRCDLAYQPVEHAAGAAEELVTRRGNPLTWLTGSLAEAAFFLYHTADVQLVELLVDDQLRGKVPEALALAKAYLPADDPRRAAFEQRWQTVHAAAPKIGDASGPKDQEEQHTGRADPAAAHGEAAAPAVPQGGTEPATPPVKPSTAEKAEQPPAAGYSAEAGTGALSESDRQVFATTLRAAYLFYDLSQRRIRRFRNILMGTALGLVVVLFALAWVGVEAPGAVPMCGSGSASTPAAATASAAALSPGPAQSASAASERAVVQVCATGKNRSTGGDVLLVELVGLAGGAMAAARALSGLNAASGHVSLPVWQAVLKLTLAGTTAVFGVLFVRAGLAPSILPFDAQAQILAYALVFGYAQQLLTKLIDARASALESDASPATSHGQN